MCEKCKFGWGFLRMEMGRKWLDMCDEMWIYGEPTEGMLLEIKQFKGKKVKKI